MPGESVPLASIPVKAVAPENSWTSGEFGTERQSRPEAAWYAASMETVSAGADVISTGLNRCPMARTGINRLLLVSSQYQGLIGQACSIPRAGGSAMPDNTSLRR